MPYYLYQMSYSPAAVKGMIATPQDREAAARKLIEGLGGKLHNLFFSFGEYDIVALCEAPDDKVIAAVSATIYATGTAASAATTKLLTPKEAMDAMAMAKSAMASYAAPVQ